MSWIFFALLAAFLAGLAVLLQKKVLFDLHAMEFSFLLAIINFVISVPLFFVADFSTVSVSVLPLVYIATLIAVPAYLLVSKAVRHMDISVVSPLLVASPAFTAVTAFLILREVPTNLQLVGIGILIVGTYILELRHGHGFFRPFRVIIRSKYVHYVFLALFLYSISSVIDRFVLGFKGLDPLAYIAFVHVFIAFNFFVLFWFMYGDFAGLQSSFNHAGLLIFLVSAFTVGYRLSQSYAIQNADVALVISIKRLSALFATVIGGEIFFEDGILRKGIACIIMIFGAILIMI